MTSLKFSPAKPALALTLASALQGCSLSGSAADDLATVAPPPVLCSTKLNGEFQTAEIEISHDERSIPVTIFAPRAPGRYTLIAFSHGALAAPDRYTAMLGPLAASGFVVLAPMHTDSEDMERSDPLTPQQLWATRNADMRLALAPSGEVRAALPAEIVIDKGRAVALGHSFGALMAQFAGGARPIDENGSRIDHRANNVAAVVAFSPPGPLPGRIDGESWASMAVPSLTLTGSADVLPGFIDDWTLHKASFENAPAGTSELWTGEYVDHYFGGMFGREKPADANSKAMFDRAMAQTLGFIERSLNRPQPCNPGTVISGEVYAKN